VKSAAGTAVAVWSGFLAALALLLAIWVPGDELANLLLWGAALAAATLAVVLTIVARRAPAEPKLLAVPDLSLGAVLIALGLIAMLVAGAAGLWLLYIGAGLLAFGAANLVRELRAARRRP
jgi:hypothetical protein